MANAVGTSSQMRKTYEDDEKKLEQALKPGQIEMRIAES